MKQVIIIMGTLMLTVVFMVLSGISFGYFATYGFELYYQLHPLPVEGTEILDYTQSSIEYFI